MNPSQKNNLLAKHTKEIESKVGRGLVRKQVSSDIVYFGGQGVNTTCLPVPNAETEKAIAEHQKILDAKVMEQVKNLQQTAPPQQQTAPHVHQTSSFVQQTSPAVQQTAPAVYQTAPPGQIIPVLQQTAAPPRQTALHVQQTAPRVQQKAATRQIVPVLKEPNPAEIKKINLMETTELLQQTASRLLAEKNKHLLGNTSKIKRIPKTKHPIDGKQFIFLVFENFFCKSYHKLAL